MAWLGGCARAADFSGSLLVAVFALSALLASTASAVNPIKETYMALGDSLAFGYSQQQFNENLGNGEQAANFEHGYTNDWLNSHLKPKTGVQLQNLGCPGETSKSLIGNGALEAGLKLGQEALEGKAVAAFGEAPCAYHELAAEATNAKFGGALYPPGYKFPLHTEYLGAGVSQLETALVLIAKDAGEGKPVTHLTLNIGANDQLQFVAKCEKEVGEKVAKGEIPPTKEAEEKAFALCLVSGALPLGTKIGENIARTLTVVREGSKFGGINYGGAVTFVGAYNPYGNLLHYPTKKEQAEGVNDEGLRGSNGLAATFNKGFGEVAAKFGGCMANTFERFNPQNGTEPSHLQKWTNMANTSTTEFPPTSGNKIPNGPDIHATPEGYKVMSAYMTLKCP